jgi:nucleoside-diphosphate-sugar epimerase
MHEPRVVCVTGASGFLGRHLVRALQGEPGTMLRTLSRRGPHDGQTHYRGDLYDAASLRAFVEGAAVLINLVNPADAPDDAAHAKAIRQLADAARQGGVARVLHVSTAVVVGRCDALRIDENTPCRPRTEYEHRKGRAERVLAEHLGSAVDLGILRPTAIVGEGSANLRKLASLIAHGPAWKRQALRMVHGHRQMHLVPVERVVAALLMLASDPRPLAGATFVVGADDDPLNRYQAIDARLGQLLGKPVHGTTPAAPTWLLRFALRMLGRSLCDPRQRFSDAKLAAYGLSAGHSLDAALVAFARGFAAERNTERAR